MPESRSRTKAAFTAPPAKSSGPKTSPRWWAPTFVSLLVIGVVYMCVYYLSNGEYPIPGIRTWNMLVGLVIMLIGFGMTMRWK